MKHPGLLSICLSILIAMCSSGCGTSQQSSGSETPSSLPPPSTPAAQDARTVTPADTVSVQVQNQTRPTYDSRTTTPVTPAPAPGGRFSVQVGAYKLADNADRIAALAKERFGRNVYTVHDRISDIVKVMVGDFMTKEEARSFRDDMAKQFPGDYRDAWVTEIGQK